MFEGRTVPLNVPIIWLLRRKSSQELSQSTVFSTNIVFLSFTYQIWHQIALLCINLPMSNQTRLTPFSFCNTPLNLGLFDFQSHPGIGRTVSHCASNKRSMMVQHLVQTCVIDTEGVSWIWLSGRLKNVTDICPKNKHIDRCDVTWRNFLCHSARFSQ